MSTVLRIKRRAEESPQEALVLLSKRAKTDCTDDEKTSDLTLNVFVFSGTVSDKDNLNTHVKLALSKQNDRLNELNPTKNTNEIIQKVRDERKQVSLASRYEILNLSRGLTQEDLTDCDYAVVDVARTDKKVEDDVEYAYDLYFSQKKDFNVSTLDDVVRIEDLEEGLMFGSHRDNGRRTPSDRSSVSSDDSNDENNWRNDYPDTEPSSVDEEDMRKAMEDIDIGNDLSSDNDEEDIYNEPSIDMNDLNKDDVVRYGLAYAKYKSRVLADENKENTSSDDINMDKSSNDIHDIENEKKSSEILLKSKKNTIEDKGNFVFCGKDNDSDESSEGYKDQEDGFYYGMEEDGEQFVSQYGQEESDDDSVD